MLLNLTEEQIIQLAPDAASVKAGKGLATRAKWVLLEHSDRAIWGHCQGSGKTPYQTVIDTKNIAFKCSCPSRKFPCKHGLGLLFLYAAQAELFKEANEPEWVTSWLSKREEKAEKKEQKTKSDTPVDEAAQAKRQAMRHQKVLNGIDELEIWLKDLLRNGLINIPERAYTLFDGIARRMVDAQAPGLANRLKAIQEINFYEESWKYKLTDQLGKLYLLMRSYRNLDLQPEEWQQEIRTQIGYPQAKEDVLAGETITDQWLVLHKKSQKINELNNDIYWLYGCLSNRFAIYLSFTAPGTLAEFNLVPGSTYDGIQRSPATEPICRKCTCISRKSATGCSKETTLCAGYKQRTDACADAGYHPNRHPVHHGWKAVCRLLSGRRQLLGAKFNVVSI